MCAAAYVLLLEQLRRRVEVETQAALYARAAGRDVEVPDPVAIRHRFDELLAAEPVRVTSTRQGVLLEAFGLGGG